jgi:ribosomal RNA-processing protein 8
VNPVKVIAAMLKKKSEDSKLTIADFGCGDAYLARTLGKIHKIHSFDMVAANDMVTACDMAHVPLNNSSVDVAVFCLSLMGTNLCDFLSEAFRVLKPGGELIVAEVKSRFVIRGASSSSDEKKEDSDDAEGIRTFVKAMKKMHFKLLKKHASNKMFVLFRFRRTKKTSVKIPTVFEWNFKPCLYKKR